MPLHEPDIVGGSPVASVNGQTGAVTLTKSDLSLANVDNTADTAKPVSTAAQTALDAKAASSHNHAASEVNSGTLDIARVPTGTSSSTVSLGNHTHGASGLTMGLGYVQVLNQITP